jgi:hypothetical protein
LGLGSTTADRLCTAHGSIAATSRPIRLAATVRLWWRRGRKHVTVHWGFRLLAHSALKLRLHQIGRSEGELLFRSVVLCYLGALLHLRASESGESIGTIRCGDQACLSKIVLRLQVLDLGVVGTVDNTDWDGEDGVALGLVSEGPTITSIARHTSAASLIASSMTSWSGTTFSLAAKDRSCRPASLCCR